MKGLLGGDGMTVDMLIGGLDEILTQRKAISQSVENSARHLQEIGRRLGGVELHRQNILSTITAPEVREKLQRLSQDALNMSLASELQSLRRLHRRFSRTTVNIGVVGRARQGKSRLLQAITGLSSQEIPDGSSSHCTGVRSTILHISDQEQHALVSFQTEGAFVEHILGPYFRELHLGGGPQSLRQFSETKIPPLPEDLRDSPVAAAKYEHLVNYRSRLHEYSDLIGAPPRKIPLSEVRSYVAQDTVEGERLYHRFLAVSEVRVFCRFPAHGVERCAVIDMPGLGDTGIGDEERLITTLSEDVDLIVFVKMPKSTGDFWGSEDVGLYELAARSVKDVSLEASSFMVLNRTKRGFGTSDNTANCERLASDARDKHIRTARLITVDCSDADAVRREVFAKAINYLSTACRTLDAQYVAATQQRISALQDAVARYVLDASVALGRGGDTEQELIQFDQLFEQAWSSLTSGLESLSSQLRDHASEPSVEFAQEVEQIIGRCRENPRLPTVAEIRVLAQQHGAYTSAFNVLLHRLRTQLAAEFSGLEATLKISLDGIRSDVAKCLAECGLRPLSDNAGTSFLRDLRKLLGEDAPTLAEAVDTICQVDLTYRGFLQYRLRQHLMVLHPDGLPRLQQIQVLPTPESVLEALEVLYADALYRIETAFEEWYSEPNEVAAAIVDEFLDRTLRSANSRNEWRNFFLHFRSEIWESQFDELGERTRAREAWEGYVSALQAANGSPIQVLNAKGS